jgi:hypothetical protein
MSLLTKQQIQKHIQSITAIYQHRLGGYTVHYAFDWFVLGMYDTLVETDICIDAIEAWDEYDCFIDFNFIDVYLEVEQVAVLNCGSDSLEYKLVINDEDTFKGKHKLMKHDIKDHITVKPICDIKGRYPKEPQATMQINCSGHKNT